VYTRIDIILLLNGPFSSSPLVVCVCAYEYVFLCVYECIYMCIYIYAHTHIYVFMFTCINICIFVYVYSHCACMGKWGLHEKCMCQQVDIERGVEADIPGASLDIARDHKCMCIWVSALLCLSVSTSMCIYIYKFMYI